MIAAYKVRKGFVVDFENGKYPEGKELKLTDAQYQEVAHQVEPIELDNPTKKEAK